MAEYIDITPSLFLLVNCCHYIKFFLDKYKAVRCCFELMEQAYCFLSRAVWLSKMMDERLEWYLSWSSSFFEQCHYFLEWWYHKLPYYDDFHLKQWLEVMDQNQIQLHLDQLDHIHDIIICYIWVIMLNSSLWFWYLNVRRRINTCIIIWDSYQENEEAWVLGYGKPKYIDVLLASDIEFASFLFCFGALVQRAEPHISHPHWIHPQQKHPDCFQSNNYKLHWPPCHFHQN